ncbi:DUF6083 domain-containing protein [Streptomyces griseocarneus]|uniref:DUF6083 domain-containing protein n=1 Tax=Streptomyces griseocarneus TaxID=51201 RepID=UPI0019979324|nr:DUF6083 domain-containing protein [Streptomyces griseocarneus]MBZ6473170.1 hypothetical protein [Streptomyces griseocarneus]GHG60227.1 hypothetical protein GCM10018779_27380 [Streptomyces griseocarneus]
MVCEACDSPYARWVVGRGTALCVPCERVGAGRRSREPVLVGEVLGATADVLRLSSRTGAGVPDPWGAGGGGAVCRACGGRAVWHRTVRGRWVLIQAGEWPVAAVPAGRRWRIAGDGTAVRLGAAAAPSDTCRVGHADVCPARPAPYDAPSLLALWHRNARRAAL